MRGQLKKGVEKTPSIIKPYLKSKNIYSSKITNSMYKDIFNLYELNKKIDGPRINIGGDHSMSIATVGYSLNRVYNLKVIWVDAHADINTSFSSLTNNYHGMPLGFLTGLDKSNRFPFITYTLKFENILYIGIRDLDDFELNVIDKCNIKYITCDEINKDPYLSILRIKQFLNNQSFHLSFDVDSMDPSVISSTGTIVDNGLLLEPTKVILENLMKSPNMINMDITELNLDIGNKNKSLENILNIINF
jgi:arginase